MSKVKIEGNASGTGTLTISAPNTNTDRTLTLPDAAGEVLVTDGTVTIDDTNDRVGIGTSSPSEELHIYKNTTDSVDLKIENSEGSATLKANNDSFYIDADNHVFRSEASSERMRIDSSGNLLVGTTTAGGSNGITFHSSGYIQPRTNTGIPAIYADREGSDGSIIELRKDGTTVGSIGVNGTSEVICLIADDTGIGLNKVVDAVYPIGSNLGARDNAVDLGISSARWDDVYATNGTIQTSDQNEKQQIASLTDAEMNVAKRLSALFKTYKWNSSVEENGDNARTHTGIIAQDMQQAFTDEGLDAGNYAMFISSTWWETSTDVPAVEAVAYQEATYDEDGNELTPEVQEVEGVDAYTRIDTFETQEEAPEGATERTRLGVRYPELFAFINAYNDQRFEALETRIETLENP